MTKRVALYSRVSTDQQTTENQRRELQKIARRHGWKVVAVFIDDGISGSKGRDQRPGFNELLKGVARKDYDLVAAWSVDRLGRSLQDLVAFLTELRDKKVDLYLHTQGLDTSTSAGRALFGMLGVFAEFERTIIQERVRAGLARAKAQGTRLGRPPTDARMLKQIRDRLKEGAGILRVARELEVGTSVVQKVARELRN